jgi:hypothetical protein
MKEFVEIFDSKIRHKLDEFQLSKSIKSKAYSIIFELVDLLDDYEVHLNDPLIKIGLNDLIISFDHGKKFKFDIYISLTSKKLDYKVIGKSRYKSIDFYGDYKEVRCIIFKWITELFRNKPNNYISISTSYF